MNDRFKLRVWDKENNKMFTPPRHFNYSNVNGTIVCIESFCRYDGFYQKRIIKEFNDAILMQCTGLKDKNGKLIYEGDILKTKEHNLCEDGELFKVFYQETLCQFLGKSLTTNNCIDLCDLYEEEIIGNIYENKELL